MIYQCLEQAYEAHNDWFDQQTQNMSDDDAEAHASSIGFNEDQPLMDFEAFQNFYSYRRWLDTYEEIWANQGINSLNYNYTLDYIQNTLISRSRMIRIGNITTYYHSDSKTYQIKTNDCAIINLASTDITAALAQHEHEISLLLPTKKTYNANCGGFYYDHEDYEKGTIYYQYTQNNNTRQFKYDYKVSFFKIKFDNPNANYQYRYYLRATMNNFLQRNNGNWRKKRVLSACEGTMHIFDQDFSDCEKEFSRSNLISTYKARRKRKNKPLEVDANIDLFITSLQGFQSNGRFYISNSNSPAHHTQLLMIN